MSLADLNQYNPNLQFVHPPPPPPAEEPPRAKKQTRITRACDFCHSRSTKCKQNPIPGEPCFVCLDFSKPCTYNRPIRKRGIPGKAYKPPPIESATKNDTGEHSRDGESDARMLLELTNGIQSSGASLISNSGTIPEKWKGMVLANESKVKDLMEVYLEVIYPMYPLFHAPTLKERLDARDYLSDVSFFAEVMSTCALAAAKATDQALVSGRWNFNHLSVPHVTFFEAARDVTPSNTTYFKDLPWLRTYALATLYGLQTGQKDIFYEYLGRYFIITGIDALDDEANWPKDLDVIEIEVRRRVFWSMYSIDVLASVVWGNRIRHRETSIKVSYPSEVDDEFITAQGFESIDSSTSFFTTGMIRNSSCWLHGWNFVIDMFRLIERFVDIFAAQQQTPGKNILPFVQPQVTISNVEQAMGEVRSLHASLPVHFTSWEPSVVHSLENSLRFELQAARIVLVVQLINTILVNVLENTTNEAISTVRVLLEVLSQIPVNFMKAICTPQLFHIAGIISMIKHAMQRPITMAQLTIITDQMQIISAIVQTIESGNSSELSISSQLYEKTKTMVAYVEQVAANPQKSGKDQPSPPVDTFNIDPNLQPETASNAVDGSSKKHAESLINESTQAAEVEPHQEAYFQLPSAIVDVWPHSLNLSHGFGRAI